MKFSLKRALMLPLMASVMLVGCSKDDDPAPTPAPADPMAGKTLIFEGHAHPAHVDLKVYADEPLFVGYNKIYIRLFEPGTANVINDADVTLHPEMNMTSGMMHSTPFEDPTTSTPEDGVYEAAVVFVMPSSAGTWTLDIHLHNHANELDGEYGEEVTVVQPTETRLFSFIFPVDSASIWVSLVEPLMPEVGNSSYEVAIHSRLDNGANWTVVSTYNVEIKPWMPAMGHSSTFVNPTYTSMGHYVGEVNFGMGGLWYVYNTIKDKDGTVLVADDTEKFEMNIP
jgi:hypothetical protein